MICSNGIFSCSSPINLVIIAAFASLVIGNCLDTQEKEIVGNMLLAIGQLVIIMGIQQSNVVERMKI